MASSEEQPVRWRVGGRPLVRASLHSGLPQDGVPDLSGSDPRPWLGWLRRVWEHPDLTEAIQHASPDLATGVEALLDQDPAAVRVRRARKVTASVLRYVLRAGYRPTPFGLFAGIAPVAFGRRSSVRWGSDHRAVVTPGGAWVADVVAQLSALAQVREHLSVVANNTATEREGRLVIPQYARPGPGHPRAHAEQVEIGVTDTVRLVLETARESVPWSVLVAKVAAEYPDEPRASIDAMLADLVEAQALLADLAPPSVEPDPLGHLLRALTAAQAEPSSELRSLLSRLSDAHTAVEEHNRSGGSHSLRCGANAAVACLSTAQSLDVDVRMDVDLVVPEAVARVAEQAAHMLAVVSPHPDGIPWWRGFRERFFAWYGEGLVPLVELVRSSGGTGGDLLPGLCEQPPEETAVLDRRNRWLLEQAQSAALDRQREIDADELLNLGASRVLSPPDHTELNLRLESPTRAALDSGRFRIAVLGASRSAATMAGRFAALAGAEEDLPEVITRDGAAVPVQVSFPPVQARSALLGRSVRLFEHVLHVAEHPFPGSGGITVDDLAVGCDEGGLFLWSHRLGRRVEPVVPHAMNLRYAPPLVRFLAELPRADRTVLTGFDWGAAFRLPFLPRVRSGKVVLSPARWRVRATELPSHAAPWSQWQRAWSAWAQRRNLPGLVDLGAGDQRLRLDLAEAAHLYLLRAHLDKEGSATLTEAPAASAFGWCEGRPTEVVVQLSRTEAS
ncbi:hypothetical protein CQJ94_16390 [Glycomyces fuscus]|nr:hypothetical protein CQJ94_16390 [Glycomyces fuscus]